MGDRDYLIMFIGFSLILIVVSLTVYFRSGFF